MIDFGLKIHIHNNATATQAETTGIKKAVLRNFLPINFWSRRRAAEREVIITRGIYPKIKPKVCLSDSQKFSSANNLVKFENHTKFGGVSISHSKNVKPKDARIGNATKISNPNKLGLRNKIIQTF